MMAERSASISQSRRHFTCVLNGGANSNGAAEAKARLSELFSRRGAEMEVLIAEAGTQIAELCHQAERRGTGIIVAAGGDGTINAVAQTCLKSGMTLGVLPLGTLNHFAKDLGISTELEPAVDVLLTGHETLVDVGEVNGKIFLNNSSVGLYPSIVRAREERQRDGDGKWWAFAKAALDVFRRYPSLHVTLQGVEEGEVATETPFVFVGNSRYEWSGLRIGSRDCLDDGLLWVYQAPHATRGSLLRLAFQALVRMRSSGELQVFSSKTCKIAGKRRSLCVSTDGEVHELSVPLNYRILPRALKVIAPAPGKQG